MVLVIMEAPWPDDRGPPVAPLPLQATEKGEGPRHTIRRMPWMIALSLVVRLLPIELAVSAPAEPPSRGASVRLHDTATSSPHQAQEAPLILLRVRALVPEKVKRSDPAQRTVRATVLAIDEELNQVKVQTDEGQRLGLFLPPETLAHLRLGTRCVARQSMQDAARPPVQERPFW